MIRQLLRNLVKFGVNFMKLLRLIENIEKRHTYHSINVARLINNILPPIDINRNYYEDLETKTSGVNLWIE
jgi:hypothetical protein